METVVVRRKVDPKKYGRLLVKTLPRVIQTEAENERMLAIADQLMSKREETLTPEEDVLLELVTTLIEQFEEKHYPIPEASPHAVLEMLMEQRALRQRDIAHIFGSRGLTSEVINGKRSISKTQARKLADYFNVSPELFI